MPWYKLGTVTVTADSATVTGANTAFSSNARVGDAFRGPDGRWYEVTNIASATVLSIAPNYQGTTASGQTYALAPMQGYVKESADRLRALVDQYGGQLSSLQPWATAASAGAALDSLGFSASGKTVATGTPAEARAALELTKQTSRTDTTSGRVLLTGAGGWMGDVPVGGIESVDDRAMRGWRYVGQSTAGIKPSTYGHLLTFGNENDQVCQEFWELTGGSRTHRRWFRQVYNQQPWGDWVEITTSVNSLGWGQTWQDVTTARQLNVVYLNSTGRPIQVHFAANGGLGESSIALYNQAGSPTATIFGATIATNFSTVTAIIPSGHSYLLSRGGYGGTRYVQELR